MNARTSSDLVVNCEKRSIDLISGALFTPAAYAARVQHVETVGAAARAFVAQDWMPLPPGSSTLYVSEPAQGAFTVTVSWREGWLL